MLCISHNNSLRPLDDAGLAMCRATFGLHEAGQSSDQTQRTFCIDGDAFERWMLETLIGGLYSGQFRVSLTETETIPNVCPPMEWLEILYHKAEFPKGYGLYWQPAGLGCLGLENREEVEFLTWLSSSPQHVIGMRSWLYGFHFVLLVAGSHSSIPSIFDAQWYRPAGLQVLGCNTQINFTWRCGNMSAPAIMYEKKALQADINQ